MRAGYALDPVFRFELVPPARRFDPFRGPAFPLATSWMPRSIFVGKVLTGIRRKLGAPQR